MRRPFILLALACLPLGAGADEPWKTEKTKDGITVERRSVPGSSFYEYRARTRSPAPPVAVLAGLWSGLNEDLPKSIFKRQFIRRSENEAVVYDQIKTPVVSDRDLVYRVRKKLDPATGVAEVHFTLANDVGLPPHPRYVRIPAMRGSWLITPAPGGGSDLTYRLYSEPGGAIAAFLVRGAQLDQMFLDMKRILARALAAAR